MKGITTFRLCVRISSSLFNKYYWESLLFRLHGTKCLYSSIRQQDDTSFYANYYSRRTGKLYRSCLKTSRWAHFKTWFNLIILLTVQLPDMIFLWF